MKRFKMKTRMILTLVASMIFISFNAYGIETSTMRINHSLVYLNDTVETIVEVAGEPDSIRIVRVARGPKAIFEVHTYGQGNNQRHLYYREDKLVRVETEYNR